MYVCKLQKTHIYAYVGLNICNGENEEPTEVQLYGKSGSFIDLTQQSKNKTSITFINLYKS